MKTIVVGISVKGDAIEHWSWELRHSREVNAIVAVRSAAVAFLETDAGKAYQSQQNGNLFGWENAILETPIEFFEEQGIDFIIDLGDGSDRPRVKYVNLDVPVEDVTCPVSRLSSLNF